MLEAKLWSTRSKDPSRKIGAIIANNKKPIAQGYNGFPKNMSDDVEYLNNREVKYKRTLHAEVNALHNALEFGVSVKGCTMYVYGLPTCSNCALHIIQAGITHLIYCDVNSENSIWVEERELAMSFMVEAGILVTTMDKKDLDNYETLCYKSST